MSVAVGIGLALGGYTLGFIAAGLLLSATTRDLRNVLQMVLENPDDMNIRDLAWTMVEGPVKNA
jgi:hypothetical protein